jgi:hypothetical protein
MKTTVEQVVEVLSQTTRDRLIINPKVLRLERKISRNLLLSYCEEITTITNTILDEMKQLNELSIRTGAITVYVMKVKQYANKVTSNVSKLRTLASRLDSITDQKDRNKIDSEIVRLSADNDENKRKMIMYSTLVSAAGGLGNDRTYKLLKKQTTKRKR